MLGTPREILRALTWWESDRPLGAVQKWGSQVHRGRSAEQRELVTELLLALRNARLEELGDPVLREAGLGGDDQELLRALVAYFQARHWHLGPRVKGEPPHSK